MREWIYGRNPVHETLRAARRNFFQLNVAQGNDGQGALKEILSLCQSKKISVRTMNKEWFESLRVSDHQGIALEVSAYP